MSTPISIAGPQRANADAERPTPLRLEDNPNGPIAALDEGRPGFEELLERKAVGRQRLDVDRAAGDQLQAAAGDAARIGQRAVDVQVPAHDRAQVDARQFAPRPGEPASTTPPPRPASWIRRA